MTPLVLVPGMMCDARLFAPQIAALSGRRPLHLAAISDHDSVEALAAAILAAAPLRFALPGFAEELLLGGQRVVPVKAQASGFADWGERRAFAKPRSVAINRSSIGTMSLTGSSTAWPLSRASTSA